MPYHQKWSQQEKAILQKCVAKSPQNLEQAFKSASKILSRSHGACMNKWYTEVQYKGEQMSTNGNNVKLINRKNIPQQKMNTSQLVSIANIVYQKLSKDEQKQFLINKLFEL